MTQALLTVQVVSDRYRELHTCIPSYDSYCTDEDVKGTKVDVTQAVIAEVARGDRGDTQNMPPWAYA